MVWFTRIVIMFTMIGVTRGVCTNCDRCVNNTCVDPDQGWCFCVDGCKQGYFGQWCNYDCPDQCLTCGRNYEKEGKRTKGIGICYECNDGYHNGSSTNCLCPINCQQCTSTTQCSLCNQGWYGTMCELSCPTNCMDQICNITNGVCTKGCNSESFVGYFCNSCVNGFYGDDCDLPCSTNCKDQICRKSDGVCTNGCIVHSFEGNFCNECRNGFYGDNCDLSCSTNCKDQICRKSDGVCTNGCIGESFEGDYCNNCRNGFYGDNCNLLCSSNCKDDTCTQTSGYCQHGCKSDSFGGMKCDTCKTGFYGEQCNLKCPLNCKLNICDERTGECTQGCNGNSAGRRCDVCIDGFYGNDCTTKCPSSNCFKSRCNISTGICESCMDGYYGSFCDVKCYRSCLDNKCDQLTGDCSNGSHGNSEAIQDCGHSTSSFIAGWIFGGVCLTLNVVLVVYICYTRRQKAVTETRHGAGRNDTQVIYTNDAAEIVSVEPEQINTYEDLNKRTDDDTSIYNVPQ